MTSLIHQLATAHLVRDQRVHRAPRPRDRHHDVVPVHLPRHGRYFRFELKVPVTKNSLSRVQSLHIRGSGAVHRGRPSARVILGRTRKNRRWKEDQSRGKSERTNVTFSRKPR